MPPSRGTVTTRLAYPVCCKWNSSSTSMFSIFSWFLLFSLQVVCLYLLSISAHSKVHQHFHFGSKPPLRSKFLGFGVSGHQMYMHMNKTQKGTFLHHTASFVPLCMFGQLRRLWAILCVQILEEKVIEWGASYPMDANKSLRIFLR